ncbi:MULTISPECIES: alpha-ketoglutarate-dependent dioxygenase AlkB [Acinetobacter]|uniref:Alpha-ketoglutarate-dependent dioxygenase AlkB n=1 Tax=Acinetobacter piscicola TaxID=2006115 RepID=A0A7S6VUC5_9GAMM|nr:MULTISPECIES: alpha-ketoglutarate-dependent dioxygenase AlkB [Acinetobacter]QOW44867.1 alpha-ketoglutarate-dependent dioxygenase AlkB [Acinetobacter piscicola]
MKDILYIDNFIEDPQKLFEVLSHKIVWDSRMTARKTASFGKAYNYSQMSYPEVTFLEELKPLIVQIENVLGFEPNNCLINFYENGQARMGWHSDQTDILYPETGVAIVSLGSERILKFRKIGNPEITKEYLLASGSLLYMTQSVQKEWQHAIPKHETDQARMSLTFRKIL